VSENHQSEDLVSEDHLSKDLVGKDLVRKDPVGEDLASKDLGIFAKTTDGWGKVVKTADAKNSKFSQHK